ncbi:MAG TPA: hypothetical protein VK179_00975 [Bacteroidales bacterium]|nr:hypothetical protein [Bacteroidales bacterium]
MLPEKRNLATNWIDGMKLNKDHFIGLDNWLMDGLRDMGCIQMTDHNYGLLEGSGEGNSSLNLMISFDQNNQINVKLAECRAITKGGIRVELNSQNIQKLLYPLEKLSMDFNISDASNEMFDLILAVFPDKRVPVGQPVENETPFRHPWVMPEIQINAVPTKQVNSSQLWKNHITIARFQVVAHEVHVITEYIPPCSRVTAYPALFDYYMEFENKIEKITNALAEYLRKNRTDQTKLNNNLIYVIEKLVYYLTINLSHYKMILKTQPPVFMIEFFIRFARLFKSALSWLSEYDREEVLNHFSHWVSSRDLDNAAFELMNLEYDHQDIYASVAKVEIYLELVYELFEKMVFSGKVASPVHDLRPAGKGPVIIKDGKRIN